MQRKLIRPGDWQKLALKLLNELIKVEDEENQEIHNDILQRMLKVGAYPIVSFINLTLDSLSLIIVTLSVCLTWKGPKVKSTNDWMDCINASLGANGVEEENMHHYKQYIEHLHWVLNSFEEYAAIDPLLLTPDWHSKAVKILGEGQASANAGVDHVENGTDNIGMAIDRDKGEGESEEEEKQVQEGDKDSEHVSSSDDDADEDEEEEKEKQVQGGEKGSEQDSSSDDDDEEEEKHVHEGEKGEKGEKSLIQ